MLLQIDNLEFLAHMIDFKGDSIGKYDVASPSCE